MRILGGAPPLPRVHPLSGPTRQGERGLLACLPLDLAGPILAGLGAAGIPAGGGRGGENGGRGRVPPLLGDNGHEQGQSLDEAPDLLLEHRDQPTGREPAGSCRDGLDQTHHGDAEALRRGKDRSVVHILFLRRTREAGQGEKHVSVFFSSVRRESGGRRLGCRPDLGGREQPPLGTCNFKSKPSIRQCPRGGI